MVEGISPQEVAKGARSGQPWGEVPGAAKVVSDEITKTDFEKFSLQFQTSQAEARIRGVKDAHPRVLKFALEIVGGFGTGLAKRGERMLSRAERQRKAAEDHSKAFLQAVEASVEGQAVKRENEAVQALYEAVPKWIAKHLEVNKQGGPGILERVRLRLLELYHEELSAHNLRRAEINGILGGFYYDVGSYLEALAKEIGGKRWPKEKAGRLGELGQLLEEKRRALEEIGQRRRSLEELFRRIVTEGPEIAQEATRKVEKTPASDEPGQKRVVEDSVGAISNL